MRMPAVVRAALAFLAGAALSLCSTVKIVRDGANWRLLRDGRPYFVKGAVGAVHLEDLVAAGGNSIRAGANALDRAQSLGLSVLVNLPAGKQRMGFDYGNQEAVNRQRAQIRSIVEKYKDHPAVLAWAIGNELEIRTTPEERAVLWKEVNSLAEMIHALDPNHPVITPIGDAYRRMLSELNRYAPALDAVGLNSYVDMLTLPEDIAKQGWTRPYLVTEFGPRGHWQVRKAPWKVPIEDTSTQKAEFYLQAYRHSVEGQPQCLGSYVFHWAQHHEKTHTWYGMFLEDGSRTGAVDAMAFAWTGHWPANRSPRIAALKLRTEEGEFAGPAEVRPGERVHAEVEASDPDGDPLTIHWDLRPDVSDNPNVGGDREEPASPIDGALLSASGARATVRIPDREAKFRLFVYVRDGHGNAATANLPLLAKKKEYPPAPAPSAEDAARFGAGIQRTMALLAASTPRLRIPVRILFYGQSITKQDWWLDVAEDLRRRFPYADLTILNRAIGGYSSPYLIRTLPHDVYGFYPDLVILHDFGDEALYEQIVSGIRGHTTAEVLLQSDYPTTDDRSSAREVWHDRHSFEWLPALAEKYGCGLVDVRHPWTAYLSANKLKAAALLRDGVHLNAQGNYLLAALTKRHLRHDPEAKPAQTVRTYEVGRDLEWRDGRLTFEFEGNRIDAIAGPGDPDAAASAEVLIDGRRPSELPELYLITRPTDTWAVDWPAVNRVSAEKPLLIEDWTLRVLQSGADDSQFRFEVTGSRTGRDGTGTSTERFVSNSGRVIIEPGDWGVKRAFDLRKIAMPAGFEVTWSVRPMFVDVYRAPRIEDPSREYSTTLALGLFNAHHKIELVATGKKLPPVRALRVYHPPVH